MKEDNIIRTKSYKFALKIVALYKNIVFTRKEFVLSKQILRSGTSIGANIEEAIGAQSKKDFIARLSIAYRESRETSYWLRTLKDTGYINTQTANEMGTECAEITKILSKILLTMKKQTSNS